MSCHVQVSGHKNRAVSTYTREHGCAVDGIVTIYEKKGAYEIET